MDLCRSVSWLTALLVALPLAAAAQFTASTPAFSPIPQTRAQARFLEPEQAFRLSAEPAGDSVRLHWSIAPGYYLYRKELAFRGESPDATATVTLPPGVKHADEWFGETEIYRGDLDVTATARGSRTLSVRWQGCAEAGLCYPPQTQRIALEGSPGPASATAPAAPVADDEGFARRLMQGSAAWTALAFFGLGLFMTFTPCVLPMVPIVSSMVVGASAGPRRAFLLSAAYVVPMALVYAAVGAAAGIAGARMQAALQTAPLLLGMSALMVLLALAMFGWYELQLPSALRNRLGRLGAQSGGSIAGAAALGAISAVMVSPCMTAPLAGALLFIGQTGNVAVGATALFALGLGMGVPLIAVGTLGGRLLPRPGPWMERVKAAFGFMLLATAIAFAARVVPEPVTVGLWGALALSIAIALHALARHLGERAQPLARLASLLAGAWGIALVLGAAAGASDPARPLAFVAEGLPAARAAAKAPRDRFVQVATPAQLDAALAQAAGLGQWSLVDFYADWCASCKAFERDVLGDRRVAGALDGVQLVRLDVTRGTPDDRALMEAYDIIGPPTLLIVGPDGHERRSDRIVGEMDAQTFMARLARARGSS